MCAQRILNEGSGLSVFTQCAHSGSSTRDRGPLYSATLTTTARRVIGFEALARLRGEDGTLVLPIDFIPAAEESGLIVPLGEEVLRPAIAQAATRGGWVPRDVLAAADEELHRSKRLAHASQNRANRRRGSRVDGPDHHLWSPTLR